MVFKINFEFIASSRFRRNRASDRSITPHRAVHRVATATASLSLPRRPLAGAGAGATADQPFAPEPPLPTAPRRCRPSSCLTALRRVAALARHRCRSDPFPRRCCLAGATAHRRRRAAVLRAAQLPSSWPPSPPQPDVTKPPRVRVPLPPRSLACVVSDLPSSRAAAGTLAVRTSLLPGSPLHRQLASSHHPRATPIRPYWSSAARLLPVIRHCCRSMPPSRLSRESPPPRVRELLGRRLSSPISCSLSLSLSLSLF
ncbi:hypothetical protein Scep_003592 [Stephania cephalantha]|uniref:Uncharacterized protein n=1 Tax=Stephania cephalantha TaxID=152367 RepID=A0AAP0KQT2_9MAGN